MSKSRKSLSSLLHRMHSSFVGRLTLGLAIGAFLLVFKLLTIEHTVPYGNFRLWMYGLVQGRFLHAGERPVVQVVDISNIPTDSGSGVAEGGPAVSRQALLEHLRRIAGRHPRAIGIDVDFSPDEHGNPITLGDEKFFADCESLSRDTSVPIFLGVSRHAADSPDAWLGNSRFQNLAAGLGVGNAEYQAEAAEMKNHVPSVLRMLSWTKLGEKNLKSLAYAVAERDLDEGMELPSWLHTIAEVKTELKPEEPLVTEGFLVNYRSLDRVQVEAVDLAASGDVPIENRFVLLGDVKVKGEGGKPGNDMFAVPGRSGLYSGVLLHACAVDTLVSSPLIQWTPRGRIILDFALTLVGLFLVEGLKWLLYTRRGHKHARPIVDWAVTAAIAAAVVLVAIPFADYFRLMWDDAVFVALGLYVHTFLHERLSKVGHHAEPAPAKVSTAAAIEPQPDSEPAPLEEAAPLKEEAEVESHP